MQLCRTPSPVRRLDLRARNGLLGFLTGVFFSQSEYWDWDAQDFDPWKLMDQILLECLNHFNQTLIINHTTAPLTTLHFHALPTRLYHKEVARFQASPLSSCNQRVLCVSRLTFCKEPESPISERKYQRGYWQCFYIYWCTEILTLTCYTRK